MHLIFYATTTCTKVIWPHFYAKLQILSTEPMCDKSAYESQSHTIRYLVSTPGI